jgi:hypothetical protein
MRMPAKLDYNGYIWFKKSWVRNVTWSGESSGPSIRVILVEIVPRNSVPRNSDKSRGIRWHLCYNRSGTGARLRRSKT